MANNTQDIIGFIGGAQTLIECFPMNILNGFKGRKYNNVIDFIIDVLHAVGVDDRVIIKKIIQKLFKVPTFNETVPNVMEQISQIDNESEFLNKIEDETKVIISNILTAILSCSVIPEIKNKYMDDIEGKNNEGFISIPLSLIDYSGMLNVCPLDRLGKNYYNVENELTINTLYKTYDLNAFIWYALNRGISVPQKEKNKMVWDNRKPLLKEDNTLRNTSQEWNEWYNSKKDTKDILQLNEAGNKLYPIMQLERENIYDNEKRLRVYISAQQYYNKDTFNRSIYSFNQEYLESIRILSTKMILTNIMQELLGGLFLSNPINYSINQTIIDAKLNEIIKKVLEGEDKQVQDCYFSFSNDDYDEMLKQSDLMRYNAKMLNSETAGAANINIENIINSLNSISSAATSNEKIETITKTIYDIAAIPSKDGAIIQSDKLGLTYNNSWLNEMVRSIVRPIVRSIMSPQVMLLFIINLETTGLISLDNNIDMSYVMTLIYNKIMSLLKSIIIYVKDIIVEFLLSLFYNEIRPILLQYNAYLVMEQLDDWLRLLNLVKLHLPKFNFGTFNFKNRNNSIISVIDDVNYADIYTLEENTQKIPEKNSSC